MIFKTIIADPPWMYNEAKKGIEKTGGSLTSGSAQKYDVMTMKEICQLSVIHIVDQSKCHLILWVTVPFLEKGMRVLNAWGFEYKTTFFWEKVKSFGLGYWFRNQYELALVGRMGDAKAFHSQDKNCFNTIKEQRGEHSQKPEQFYKLIEPLTKEPRLEMFARRQRPGWTCIGNAIDGKDIEDSLVELATKQETL